MNFDKFCKGKTMSSKGFNEYYFLIELQKLGRLICLPLSPAHSMTIHKSQSLTIPFCKIDPSNPFACGQLYVAFSRAPTHDRIKILRRVTLGSQNKYKNEAERIKKRLHEIGSSSSTFAPFLQVLSMLGSEVSGDIH